MSLPSLEEFRAVLRAGDDAAVTAALHEIEPILRRLIRLRLVDDRLRSVVETTNIVQSLLTDFLSRKAVARPGADTTGGLTAYLAAAVANKIQTKLRKVRRQASVQAVPPPTAAGVRPADEDEHQQAVRRRLPVPARRLFDLKPQGKTYAEIAAVVGGQPDTLRMQLRRAVAAALRRIARENGDDT